MWMCAGRERPEVLKLCVGGDWRGASLLGLPPCSWTGAYLPTCGAVCAPAAPHKGPVLVSEQDMRATHARLA